ncbi:unnamed protein product [Arabis nemorensis]|uniref:Uncharacterized protein n=1 Tax=Arabis nemorensis TaxID=586526 RepID=A0A565CKA1_9BRAS|nr:unnamed protein product [Arabis nemorensis]
MEFKRFKIADFEVVSLPPEVEEENEYGEKYYKNVMSFEHKLESALKVCPVTARVIMCNSNSGVEGKFKVDFFPMSHSLSTIPLGMSCRRRHGVITCFFVGMGVEKNGVPFWEFQNSGGKELGDNEYTRVARYRGLVTNFILLE